MTTKQPIGSISFLFLLKKSFVKGGTSDLISSRRLSRFGGGGQGGAGGLPAAGRGVHR